MGLLFLMVFCLASSMFAIIKKNTTFGWIVVPLWPLVGYLTFSLYDWLGVAQWIFILLGGTLAIAMVYEVIRFKDKEEDEEGEEVDEVGKTWFDYNKQMDELEKNRRMRRKLPRIDDDF
jgi:hypothetical protein